MIDFIINDAFLFVNTSLYQFLDILSIIVYTSYMNGKRKANGETMSTDIKQIAKTVRAELKSKHPECKFSVTISRYTGGQAMTVALMAAPFEAIRNNSGYQQLNQYVVGRETYEDYFGHRDDYLPTKLTPPAWKLMKSVYEIADRENWNNSDAMIDYFDVNYYLDLHVGKWNKDFAIS